MMRQQWRAAARWIEDALAAVDGGFLGGGEPNLSDVVAYMNIWWLAGASPAQFAALSEGFARLIAWRERMRAIGHGQRSEMTPEEALATARDAAPAITIAHDRADPLGLAPGARVVVMADDYGRDPIAGALVAANAERIVIARDTPDLGRLHVHFPRAGYAAASDAS
jgi:hypothetical protein